MCRRELIGLGGAAWCLGDLWRAVLALGGTPTPFPSPAEAAFALLPVLVGAGLCRAAGAPSSVAGRWRFAVEALMISCAGLVIACSLVLGPLWASSASRTAAGMIAVAYPLLDIAMVGLLLGILARSGPAHRPAHLLLTAGAVLLGVADTAFAVLVAHGAYAPAGPVGLLYVGGLSLFAYAAARADSTPVEVASHSRVDAVLYVPVAVAVVVAAAQLIAGAELGVAVTVALLVIVVLGTIRQASASRENAALTRDLERRVTARTEELTHVAFHDPLTGLPNRAHFCQHVAGLLEIAPPARVWVLLADVDEFKDVNDTLGHGAGDELLAEVATRLRAAVPDDMLLARLGGDEFAAVLCPATMEDAEGLASRMLGWFRDPLLVRGRTVSLSLSIGIAPAPADATGGGSVLRDADLAMYAAKAAGRRRWTVFDPSLREAVSERLQLEADLRHAIANSGLRLVYQPVVDLATGRVTGVEALARWRHPERGEIPPAVFVPLAEESDLVLDLGAWVLDEACRTAAGWVHALPHRPGAGAPRARFTVAVNLSVRELQAPGLVERVIDTLARHDLPAAALVVEVTESVFMNDYDTAVTALRRLRACGVSVAIDDFGTGYSSLAYLQRLPVDILKLDRTFVAALTGADRDARVTGAVVALARNLGLALVGEGVEEEAQAQALLELGCAHGQGFGLHRPAPPEVIGGIVAAADVEHELRDVPAPRASTEVRANALTPARPVTSART